MYLDFRVLEHLFESEIKETKTKCNKKVKSIQQKKNNIELQKGSQIEARGLKLQKRKKILEFCSKLGTGI